jgi:hypothetical protein
MTTEPKTRGKYAARNYEFGSYYVLQRDYERKILRETLATAEGDVRIASAALGITHNHFRDRSTLLGGVFPGDPRREPPPRPKRTAAYQKAQADAKPAKRDPAPRRQVDDQDRPAGGSE